MNNSYYPLVLNVRLFGVLINYVGEKVIPNTQSCLPTMRLPLRLFFFLRLPCSEYCSTYHVTVVYSSFTTWGVFSLVTPIEYYRQFMTSFNTQPCLMNNFLF